MFPITLYALFYLSPGTFRTPGDFSGTFKCGTQIAPLAIDGTIQSHSPRNSSGKREWE